MYCEDEKNERTDLSSKDNASCFGPKCGGWKWVNAGCAPWNSGCVRNPGAWLPAAAVCSLGLYKKTKSRRSSSSSSSASVGSKALLYSENCQNSCPEGCCSENGWVCCADGMHCADSEGSCPQSSILSGESFFAHGTAIVLSDYFDTSFNTYSFAGVVGGELLVPMGYNYAVFISADGSVHEEYVVPGQVLVFRSTILLGSKEPEPLDCDYCDCGAAEPCSWKDCGSAPPGYTNFFNCDTCKCTAVILTPTGNNSSSSSSSHSSVNVLSVSISKQFEYGTVTTVSVASDGRVVDKEYYGAVYGGSDVVHIANNQGVIPGMIFSVQGDCVHNDITSFSAEVMFVEGDQITLSAPVPGSESCPSAAIMISGPELFEFEFDGELVKPYRVGPASGHPYGYPDIIAGQYQFFYDFGGSSLRVAKVEGGNVGAFSPPVQIAPYDPIESSSSSESPARTVFTFVELEVSSGEFQGESEFIIVAVDDPQLSVNIDIAGKNRPPDQCQNISAQEACPPGYFDDGLSAPCQEECEKRCCPDTEVVSNPMLCGKVYSGLGNHNRPWSFYLDPDSVRLLYLRNLQEESLVGIMPSEISDGLGSFLPEGSECCFPIRDKVRFMDVVGFDYCEAPLLLNAERVFDPDSGEYVAKSTCEGDCESIEENYCLDQERQALEDYVQTIIDFNDQKFNSMDEQGLIAWLSEDMDDFFLTVGADPDGEYTDEQLEEMIILYEEIKRSSSSSYQPSSSSVSRPMRGSWSPDVEYLKDDLVSYDGSYYYADENMATIYPVGYGPSDWVACSDGDTFASSSEQCPGYKSFDPFAFLEGWTLDSSLESYTSKAFDDSEGFASVDATSPTRIAFELGENTLVSSVGPSRADTYFSFEVPAKRRLSGVLAYVLDSDVGSVSASICDGSEWNSDSIVVDAEFGSGPGGVLFESDALPSASGLYSLRISSTQEFDYALVFVLELA